MKDRIEFLKKRLFRYYEAEQAVLLNQSYQFDTKKLERANLAEIRKAINELETEIHTLENGGKRKVFRIIPADK